MPEADLRQILFIYRRVFEVGVKRLEFEIECLYVYTALLADLGKNSAYRTLVEPRCNRRCGCRLFAVSVAYGARVFAENGERNHEFRALLNGRFHEVEHNQMRDFFGELFVDVIAHYNRSLEVAALNFAFCLSVKLRVAVARFHELCAEFVGYRPQTFARFVEAAFVLCHENFSARVFENFDESFDNLPALCGNLLAVFDNLRAQKSVARVHNLRKRKRPESAENVVFGKRYRFCADYSAVLYFYFHAAVFGAHRAYRFLFAFGNSEPFAPPVG